MKKTIALLLAMAMLVLMLAGCGGKDQEKTPDEQENVVEEKDTQKQEAEEEEEPAEDEAPADEDAPAVEETPEEEAPAEEAVTGELLDAPEVSFDTSLEQMYIYFTTPGEGGEVKSMEIALDQVTEDMYVLYVTNGLLKLNEMIYEVDDAGITKYYKDALSEKFMLETELSQAELKNEHDSIMELLATFMMMDGGLEGVKFEKSDEMVAELTGETLNYNLVQDGEMMGKISIDKATGLMVSMKDAQGNAIYTVMEIKTSDLGIPEYK